MKALILAAGRGARLGGLNGDAPKCLVPLAGRPLLEWQLAALRGACVEEIGVVRGYRAHLLDGRGLVTFENRCWARTNMVASLACAGRWLHTGPTIVSYSDIFYGTATVATLIAAPGDIAITYDPDWLTLWSRRFADPLSDAETFRLEGSRVVDIGGRATDVDEVNGQYMGLLKITPAGWIAIDGYLATLSTERRDTLDMTGLLSALVAAGHSVGGVPVSGPWGEVDSASDLTLYERLIAEGRLTMPALGSARTVAAPT